MTEISGLQKFGPLLGLFVVLKRRTLSIKKWKKTYLRSFWKPLIMIRNFPNLIPIDFYYSKVSNWYKYHWIFTIWILLIQKRFWLSKLQKMKCLKLGYPTGGYIYKISVFLPPKRICKARETTDSKMIPKIFVVRRHLGTIPIYDLRTPPPIWFFYRFFFQFIANLT